MNQTKIQSLKNISAECLSGMHIYCGESETPLTISTKIHTESGSFSRLCGIAKGCGEGEVMVLSQEGLEDFDSNITNFLLAERIYVHRLEKGVSVTAELAKQLESHVSPSTKIIIATGGGVVCDLSKLLATSLGLPLCFVPSAPTTDSILSPFAIVGKENEMVKTKAPDFVVCDADVCKNLPPMLFRAGFGDIVGNYLAVFDWMVAKDFFNQDFTEEVAYLAISAADKAIFAGEAYLQNPQRGIELLFDAVLISSGAMALIGKHTPCCGGEHAVATALAGLDPTPRMHGENVFYCFCKLLEIYSLFFSSFSTGKYLPPDTTARCDFLISHFDISESRAESLCKPPISEDEYKIIREKYRICKSRYLPNIKKLVRKIPRLKSLFFQIYNEDGELFNEIPEETFRLALAISPDIQERYSTLTLMREFGLLDLAIF